MNLFNAPQAGSFAAAPQQMGQMGGGGFMGGAPVPQVDGLPQQMMGGAGMPHQQQMMGMGSQFHGAASNMMPQQQQIGMGMTPQQQQMQQQQQQQQQRQMMMGQQMGG